jgi:hypothetical protein
MADTAALVVALSAQLTKFEKDMKDAVTIADKRTKEIETSFSKLNSAISDQLSNLTSGFASRLGGFGSILGAIGPIGLAVAAGIGAAVLATQKLVETAEKFADSQKKLKESAESTGLTVNQFKVLARAAQEVGVDADQFETSIEKMTVAIQELQKSASGKLFDALRKFPDVLTQLSNAKDPAAAIDILAKAIDNMGNTFERNDFLKAAFGRGGIVEGRVLQQINLAGGIKEMEVAAKALGKTVDEELLERIVKLQIEIKKAQKYQEEFAGKLVTEETLTAQKQYLDTWTAIYKIIGDATQRMKEGESAAMAVFHAITTPTEPLRVTIPARQVGAAPETAPTPIPPKTLEQRIRDANDAIAALGGAATQTELLRQKELQLEKQRKEGIITDQVYSRSIAEVRREQSQLAEATRERLGVATEQQIIDGKLADIQALLAKGIITNTEAIRAQTIARKEGVEAAEALAVRVSKTPELTRFGIDAEKGFKQFDQITTATFSNFESALGSVANGTTKLADAFKNMTNSIISDLVRIAVRMSITGPLASALSGLFGAPSATALAGVKDAGWFAGLGGTVPVPLGRQGGGPVSYGRPYIVGEHGPELFVPGSSGKIVPSSVSRSGVGGSQIVVNNYVAADTQVSQRNDNSGGVNGERLIIDIVKKAQARGDFDDSQRGRFALRPQKVR